MEVIIISNCEGGLVKALSTQAYGNGSQTTVLSHGYGSDQHAWHYIIPALALYFKVLVYDLVISSSVNPKLYDPIRYSNFSAYAQDLTCILDELHVKNSVFIGHSMSAMIGCIAATKRPDLFRHLVLLSGYPRYLNDTGYDGGFNRLELESLFNDIKYNFSGWVEDFVPQAIAVKERGAVAEFKGSLGRMKPEIALSAARTVFLSDNRDVLLQVLVGTTTIQSEQDNIVPRIGGFLHEGKDRGSSPAQNTQNTRPFPQLTVPSDFLRVLKDALGIN